MSSFQQHSLHSSLLRALDELGFSEPTEVQGQTLEPALEGRDLRVSAKTGSGKSVAFFLPLLQRLLAESRPNSATRALVLVPTRELALQLQKVFQSLAKFTQIKAGLVIGGEPFKYQIAALRRNPEVLIGTPGRIVEHIEKGSVELVDLEVLVLDEADRMLDMGFVEQMHAIIQACPAERQSMLFSATLGNKGLNKLTASFREPLSLELDSSREINANIHQQRVFADDDTHKNKLTAALIKQHDAEKSFVFCKTRAQSQKVSNLLRSNGVRADYIHGELTQSERKQVLNRFRDGKLAVLVATDLAARGLDVDGVDLVVNFSVAHSGDEHLHRVGRTGRAGEKGLAITLASASEWNLLASIERYLKADFEDIKVQGLAATTKPPAKPTKKKASKKPSSKRSSAKAKKARAKSGEKPSPKSKRGEAGNKKPSVKKEGGFGLVPKRKG